MAKRRRVGLVGVGRGSGYGRLFAEEPRCEIVACCDLSTDALARFQRELKLPDSGCHTDYASFVRAGLDIVFIGTPMPAHAEQTIAALEAGCAVLCEVTAATTVEDCRRIVAAVRRTGGTYMLAENCVYWHFVQQWRQLVADGRLGAIVHAECEYVHPIPALVFDRKTGQAKWRTGRAPLHYCSHSLGPILEMTGDRIVRACGLGQGHRILPEGGTGGIDLQVGLFETANGATIKLLRSSVLPRHPPLHYYALHGTRGFIESNRTAIGKPGLLYIEGEMQGHREVDIPVSDPALPESARAGGHGTAEYCLVQDFLSALDRGATPRLDVTRAMDMTVPGLVAHESALRGGAWLDVPALT